MGERIPHRLLPMERRFYIAIFLTVIFTMIVPAEVLAQGRSRRVSEHERRIREIIDQRREEQAERERQRQNEDRRELLQARQEAIERGEDPASVQPATPPGGEAAEDLGPKQLLSSVVMGFKFLNEDGVLSYNTIVEEGSTFVTEVILFNVDANPIDEVRLALDYDKRFLKPVKVFDADLRKYMSDEPEFRVSKRDAMLIYDAKLSKKLTAEEFVLLRILWEAQRPTPYTGIEFGFTPTEAVGTAHTGIYHRGNNILGFSDDPADGVLSGGVMIEREGGEEVVLQGKAEELRTLYLGTGAAQSEAGLVLIAPEKSPRVGESFVVKVALNNPEGALIDALGFFITFDPSVLQVKDTSKFNWISRGVNILDGPYHEDYPWDMHRRNEVRNERGYIHYAMSLANGQSLPSGVFAEVHFVPIAPSAETEIGFVKGRPGAPDLSSIRYFGFEMLNLGQPFSLPLLRLPVYNAPVTLVRSDPESSDVATQDELAVRKLMIERD